jgi:hypothetical protein
VLQGNVLASQAKKKSVTISAEVDFNDHLHAVENVNFTKNRLTKEALQKAINGMNKKGKSALEIS